MFIVQLAVFVLTVKLVGKVIFTLSSMPLSLLGVVIQISAVVGVEGAFLKSRIEVFEKFSAQVLLYIIGREIKLIKATNNPK